MGAAGGRAISARRGSAARSISEGRGGSAGRSGTGERGRSAGGTGGGGGGAGDGALAVRSSMRRISCTVCGRSSCGRGRSGRVSGAGAGLFGRCEGTASSSRQESVSGAASALSADFERNQEKTFRSPSPPGVIPPPNRLSCREWQCRSCGLVMRPELRQRARDRGLMDRRSRLGFGFALVLLFA